MTPKKIDDEVSESFFDASRFASTGADEISAESAASSCDAHSMVMYPVAWEHPR